MKIAVDCREIIGHPTGIGRIMREFFAHIGPVDDLSFVLIGNQRTDLTGPEFARHEKAIIREDVTLWWDQVQLPALLRRIGPDLFFSPYYKTPFVSSVPSIISIFDITYFLVEPYRSRVYYSLYLKKYITRAARRSRRVLTSSANTRSDLVRHLRIDEEKIDVLYACVSDRFSRQSPAVVENIRSRYGIAGRYLLYTGNSLPHKNLDRLVAAYILLPEALRREYALVFTGNSPGWAAKIAGRGLNIMPLGFVPDDDLPALYSGAELFVFPSLYEGFGIPPVEAMACGCPVLSSEAPCMPEILGDACRYFNALEPVSMAGRIKELLDDERWRQELREKGYAQAARYTPEKMSRQLLDVLRKAAQG